MLYSNAPPSFKEAMFREAAALGASSIRLDVFVPAIVLGTHGERDWRSLDEYVRLARRYRLQVLGVLLGTPGWLERPVRGLRGACSQSERRTRDQRRVPCSRRTRIRTSTNCQIRPAVRHSRSDLVSAFGPSMRSASKRPRIHDRNAIGSAAAAHTAAIFFSEYCGSSGPSAGGAAV
jgi:hypothetical protein